MIGEIATDLSDSHKTYNFHLLAGHFEMLDEKAEDEALMEMNLGKDSLNDAKGKKGIDKLLLLSNALISFSKALTLYDKCKIEDSEGLLCFLCERYPDLELDWIIMQKILVAIKTKSIDFQEQKTIELAIIIYNNAILEKIKEFD